MKKLPHFTATAWIDKILDKCENAHNKAENLDEESLQTIEKELKQETKEFENILLTMEQNNKDKISKGQSKVSTLVDKAPNKKKGGKK